MNWIMYFLENDYEIWFLPTDNPKKQTVRIYDKELRKAVEINFDKSFVYAEMELVTSYIENVWKEHHDEEMI